MTEPPRASSPGELHLTPVRTAQQVAPVIDALRMTIADGIMRHAATGPLVAEAAVPPAAAQLFALLRAALGGRALRLDGVRAAVRYVPRATTDASLEELEARGVVTTTAEELRLTDRGRELQAALVSITEDVVGGLWGGLEDTAARLEQLADRALARVADDDGPAFHVIFPPYDPPSSTSATRLAERLAGLRFHRADAHAAAWQAAGLSLEQVVSRAGDLPDEVEHDTDVRASAPYSALSGAEREELLRGLRSLPGAPAPSG